MSMNNMRNLINRLIRIELEAYYVVELDLEGFVPPKFRQIDHSIVKLSNKNSDIGELVEFWPDDYRFGRNSEKIKIAILSHFADGDECFLAMVDGEIAGMLWVGYQGNYMLKDMVQKDGLDNKEAIIHRAYVSPKFRGYNLHAHLSSHIKSYLKEKGYKRTRGYIGINNLASILNTIKTNDRYKTLYHLKIDLFRKSLHFFPNYTSRWTKLKKPRPIAT
jgi:GNAT superfamily N-acetyltransferase